MTEETNKSDITDREAAKAVVNGMVCHDIGDRDGAIEEHTKFYRALFPHIDDAAIRDAAVVFVDALFTKDKIEDACRDDDGVIDTDELANSDWTPVQHKFKRQARLLDIDVQYAERLTTAWKRHKVGGDYWTPYMESEQLVMEAAMQDEYPQKPRHGQHGYGPNPARYVVAVELHDVREIEPAIDLMEQYVAHVREMRDDVAFSGEQGHDKDV